jgi:apolipoprotein N-acyltransferase
MIDAVWGRAFDALTALRGRVERLQGWRAGAAASGAGALAALAMAPFYLVPVLAVSLPLCVLLIAASRNAIRPMRAAAWRGWAFGFGYCAAGFYWIGYSFLVNPEAHLWLLPFAAAMFPTGMALFFVLAFMLTAWLWRPGVAGVFVFAFAMSAAEWLRGTVFTGFPWNLFGYAWGGSEWAMQFASIAGIYGLSLLTILAFASPALLAGPPGAQRWASMALSIPAFLLAFGGLRLPAGPSATVPGVALRIVQPDVPQAEKWVPSLAERNWRRLIAPLALNGGPAYTHVIWPEAAPPFLLSEQAEALKIIGMSLPRGALLITGAVHREARDGKTTFFNGLHAVDDQGVIVATYAKAHLVPFGEYLPFASVLESLGVTKLTGGSGGYTSGPGVRSVTAASKSLRGTQSSTFGPLICYEILFPRAVVDRANRPQWLVNVTDDSWFGPSTGPYQHLGIARMRAVEEGLPVIRAANTGVSAIIDPYGRVVASLPLDSQGVLDGPLPGPLSETHYAVWGNVLYTIAMAALAVWIAGARRFGKTARGKTSS